MEPDRDNIIKNIPLSWLVHKRLSREYLISPKTGSESDLFHRWRVILAWLPAVDQWELCQTFKSFVFVWMLLNKLLEQGTGNGEPGMTVFYSDPFSVLLSAILNCYADYRITYFRSQFLFLVSRSPFLILIITSISCWPKFKLLLVFQCLYRCVISFYFIIYADVKWTVSERLD